MILYRFTRSPHLFSSKMASLELLFVNQSNEDITNISINKKVNINSTCCEFDEN